MAEQEPTETQRLKDETEPAPPPPPPPYPPTAIHLGQLEPPLLMEQNDKRHGFNNKSHFSLHFVDADDGGVVDEMGPYEWSDIYRFEEGKTYLVRTAQDQPLLTIMGNLLHFAVDLDLRTFHAPGAEKSKAKKLFSVPQDALVASTPMKNNPSMYFHRQTLFGHDCYHKCLLLALCHYIEDTNDEWRRQQLPTLESDIDKVLASSLDVGPKTDGIKKSVGKILHSNIQDIRRPGTPESQANDLLTFSTYRIEGGPLYHFYIHVGTRRNKLYVPTVPFVLANTQENINSLLGKFAAADIKPHSQYTIKFHTMKVCSRCGMTKKKRDYQKSSSEMCKECAKKQKTEDRNARTAAAATEHQDQVGNNNNASDQHNVEPNDNDTKPFRCSTCGESKREGDFLPEELEKQKAEGVGDCGKCQIEADSKRALGESRAEGRAELEAQVGANNNNNTANLGRGPGPVNRGQRSGSGRNNYNNNANLGRGPGNFNNGQRSGSGCSGGRNNYNNNINVGGAGNVNHSQRSVWGRNGGRNNYNNNHHEGQRRADNNNVAWNRTGGLGAGRDRYDDRGGRYEDHNHDEPHYRGRRNYDEPHYRGQGHYDEPPYRGRGNYDESHYRDSHGGGYYRQRSRSRSNSLSPQNRPRSSASGWHDVSGARGGASRRK